MTGRREEYARGGWGRGEQGAGRREEYVRGGVGESRGAEQDMMLTNMGGGARRDAGKQGGREHPVCFLNCFLCVPGHVSLI